MRFVRTGMRAEDDVIVGRIRERSAEAYWIS